MEIGDGAFEYCSGLKKAELNEGLKVIGERAFGECWSLEDVNVPGSVERIGEWAFLRGEAFEEGYRTMTTMMSSSTSSSSSGGGVVSSGDNDNGNGSLLPEEASAPCLNHSVVAVAVVVPCVVVAGELYHATIDRSRHDRSYS